MIYDTIHGRNKSRCSAVGSVRALGAWGRRFEPCHLDHFYKSCRKKSVNTGIVGLYILVEIAIYQKLTNFCELGHAQTTTTGCITAGRFHSSTFPVTIVTVKKNSNPSVEVIYSFLDADGIISDYTFFAAVH